MESLIGITTLFIVTLFFWYLGFLEHQRISDTWEILTIPKTIRFLFTGFKNHDSLNIRGVILQLFTYIMFPIVGLYLFDKISRQTMTTTLGIASGILTCLGLFQWWLKK